MQTREATSNDREAVAALFEEFRGHTVTSADIGEHFTTILKDPNRTIIVAEDDGTVLGVAVVNLVLKLPKTEARIDEVVVSEAARGKGCGKMLMDTCEAWAWGHGADLIELTSRSSREAANALYQKLGYELRETNVYTRKRTR